MDGYILLICEECLSNLFVIKMNKNQQLVYKCAGCGEEFNSRNMEDDLLQMVREELAQEKEENEG